MNRTGCRKRVLFVAIAATLSGGLMLLPVSFEDSGYQAWTLGAVAQAEGGKGARGGAGGSHTNHDHSDSSSRSDSDHDHSDASHDSGHDSRAKGAKKAGRHRGHSVGGGSRMVEKRILEQD